MKEKIYKSSFEWIIERAWTQDEFIFIRKKINFNCCFAETFYLDFVRAWEDENVSFVAITKLLWFQNKYFSKNIDLPCDIEKVWEKYNFNFLSRIIRFYVCHVFDFICFWITKVTDSTCCKSREHSSFFNLFKSFSLRLFVYKKGFSHFLYIHSSHWNKILVISDIIVGVTVANTKSLLYENNGNFSWIKRYNCNWICFNCFWNMMNVMRAQGEDSRDRNNFIIQEIDRNWFCVKNFHSSWKLIQLLLHKIIDWALKFNWTHFHEIYHLICLLSIEIRAYRNWKYRVWKLWNFNYWKCFSKPNTI